MLENARPISSEKLAVTKKETIKYVYAPRSIALDMLICFFSMGLYLPFWFVAKTRELNELGSPQLKPPLWFFVPSVIIAQLFALPKFLGAVDEACNNHNTPKIGRMQVPYIVLFIATTLYFNLSEKLELPSIFIWVGLLVYAGILGGIQYRINQIKQRLPQDTLRPIKYGYKIWE